MKTEKYQRKINDVISKCPIEAGVEILVYNLLDEYVNEEIEQDKSEHKMTGWTFLEQIY